MAVALQTTSSTCNGEAEPRVEGGNGIAVEADPPETGVGSVGEVVVYKKGAWSKEEDEKLRRAVDDYGIKNWVTIEKLSGLGRPAKNCRLRWLNYLRPNLKKYPFTEEEEKLILDLHSKYGNCWARIASKLAGRSDNEIKNFWHKRAKKCKRENLSIYPTTKEKKQKQSHTNVSNTTTTTTINDNHSSIDEANANATTNNHDYFPSNYPNHTLPQFQPSTLNIANNAHLPTDAPSIHVHSPQTMISTQPPQFLSSPSSLLTSSHHQQSPTNHFSHQTTLFPNTPTSQTQNLLLSSPHQTSQPIPDHVQAPSLCQDGATSSSVFTSLRKPPPILSSPLRRFLRATSQSPPPGGHSAPGSANLVVNASTFLPPDSSAQVQCSSAMESPRSPLKLKLSSGIPPQLNSPIAAPLSPLKLRLSFPVPSESCFQSNLSIPDSTVQLNSSTTVVPLSSPLLEPSQPMTDNADHIIPLDTSLAVKGEPHSIQFPPPETSGVNSCMHEEESYGDLEIMDELREAQARVRFLKKKLRQRRISNQRSLLKQSSRKELLFREVSLDGKKDMLKRIVRRKGDMIGISKPKGLQVKKAKKENREDLEGGEYMQGSIDLEKATHGETSESKISSGESLQREEDSLGEIFKAKSSETFQEQRHSIDLIDHLNNQNNVADPLRTLQGLAGKCSNECSSMGDFLGESSTLLQYSFLKGDLFQMSSIEDPFSSQRHAPLIDAFDPIYSQSSATALVKPGEEGGQLSYLQSEDFGCTFRREFSDGLGREFSEDGLMDGNLAARSIQCEPGLLMHQNPSAANLLLDSSYLGCEQFSLQNSGGRSAQSQPSFIQHRYHAADLLDSGYLTSKQLMKQESLGGVRFSLQPDGCGNSSETSKLCESAFLLHQTPESSLIDSRYLAGFEHECLQIWKQQEPCGEQSLLEGLFEENLWPQGQMVSQDQTFSINRLNPVIKPMGSMNWNNESTSGYTGEVLHQEQEQDHMNTMPEELSSLLDFFPTTVQTLEWCNIGNEIPNDRTPNKFELDTGLDLQMSSTSQQLVTIADYI